METLEVKQQIALKNILFATDFEASANRALPFAVALRDRYHAKLYVASVLVGFIQQYSVDLAVVGTRSRAGVSKVLFGPVAEKIIREAPCPVLIVGPCVTTKASDGIQIIVCAIDFSPESLRAAEFAISLANRHLAHLTLVNVIEGALEPPADAAIRMMENRLRKIIPPDVELPFEAAISVESGRVGERILRLASELPASIIVMGMRGVGATGHTASHFGSAAHNVVSLAKCPVVTVAALATT